MIQLAVMNGDRYEHQYLSEILDHAGIPYRTIEAGNLVETLGRYRLLILNGNPQLSTQAGERIATWVKTEGGGLCCTGGLCSGGGRTALEELCGSGSDQTITGGWIEIANAAKEHPLTAGLRSSLHIFGGVRLRPGSAQILATLQNRAGEDLGPAIVERAAGKGRLIIYGPDLAYSVMHIQQGRPIHEDGVPAPDGSAPIDDGILKTDDGIVLDWERDRAATEKSIFFRYPIADELRELLIRGLLYLAKQQNVPLALIWYWPRQLPSVALMSHDSDHNDPDLAEDLFRLTQELAIKTCWCIIYPGGYRPDFYRRVQEYGSEIALHYDAHTGGPRTSWSQANMILQHHWLSDMSGAPLLSNKNHLLRWENYLDLFRWEEQLAIQLDQTKGPSKRGNVGFLYGGSHPWFPLDKTPQPRYLDVLEVNLHSQDLVLTCDYEVGPLVAEQVRRTYGIYHPLFHPAHVRKPGIAESIRAIIVYAQSLGMEWWTAARINAWERYRRAIRWHTDETISLPAPLAHMPAGDLPMLYILTPTDGARRQVTLNGVPATTEAVERYGFTFDATPLPAGGTVQFEIR